MRRIGIYLSILILFFIGRLSADIAGTNQVFFSKNGRVCTFVAKPDGKPFPTPTQKGIHWIQDGAPSCQWNFTGNLSPINGTNQMKLVLDLSQPCSGTVSAIQFQRWVDASDLSRMVITQSHPFSPVSLDVPNLNYTTYHFPITRNAHFVHGGTVPATLINLGLTQTRDITYVLSCSNKFYQSNPTTVILSRSTREASYEIICPADFKQHVGTFNFVYTPENE